MQTGAITGYIDVAQLVLYAFWIFFAGLIYYLHREDKREGYPLESNAPGRGRVAGLSGRCRRRRPSCSPTARTRHGAAPRRSRRRAERAAARAATAGAPLEPTGNSDARRRRPGRLRAARRHARSHPRRRPRSCRCASRHDFGVAAHDLDPRGLPVIGADGVVGGVVSDVWVDRSETLFRYLEVEVATARRAACCCRSTSRASARRRRAGRLDPGPRISPTCRRTRNPDQVTLLEEERIMAYYGAGTCTPTRRARSRCCERRTHDDEHEFEAAHGLPEPLPQGERMLWQGAPTGGRWRARAFMCARWRSTSRHPAAARGRPWLAGRLGARARRDRGAAGSARSPRWRSGMLLLMAWLTSRTTVYTITNRRVVMRVGIVLTVTFNLPFRRIESAALRRCATTAPATSR